MRGALARAHARRPRAAALGLAALAACLAVAAPAAEAGTPTPLPRLTTSQLAGQRVIYCYPGLTPPPRPVRPHPPGPGRRGHLLRREHHQPCPDPRRDHAGCAGAAQSPIQTPLLLMTDQEGGMVKRLPGAPSCRRSRSGEARDNPARGDHCRHGRRAEPRGVGINVNLAPVLASTASPATSSTSSERSFSQQPVHVSRAWPPAFITAQQRHRRGRHRQALPRPRRGDRPARTPTRGRSPCACR